MMALAKKIAEIATEKTAATARDPISLLNMIGGLSIQEVCSDLSKQLWAGWKDRGGHERSRDGERESGGEQAVGGFDCKHFWSP